MKITEILDLKKNLKNCPKNSKYDTKLLNIIKIFRKRVFGLKLKLRLRGNCQNCITEKYSNYVFGKIFQIILSNSHFQKHDS